MLTIWGRSSAFNVLKVLWLADELHLKYKHIDVGGAYGGLDSSEFLAKNPHGKIPVLEDDDLVVWESHTILRFLAANYGNDTIYPMDLKERTKVERWMDWSHTSLQPAFMDLFWGFYRTPESEQNLKIISKAAETCENQFSLLNQILQKQTYLAGNFFSLADFPAGSVLYRYFNMGYAVTEYPNVIKWYQRLNQRKAYQKWIMTDFSELKGRLEY